MTCNTHIKENNTITKLFKWDDKYSVKVASLDEQHKRFFEITNEILMVLDNPYTPDLKNQLTMLIVNLGNYALHHLSYEEGCMKSHSCTGCSAHTGVHDVYREKVKNYLQLVVKEDTDIKVLAKEVAEFSRDWLSAHILSRDREYISCLTNTV